MSLELPGSIRDVSVEISSDGRECTVTINPQKYCYNPKVMTGVKLDRGHVLFESIGDWKAEQKEHKSSEISFTYLLHLPFTAKRETSSLFDCSTGKDLCTHRVGDSTMSTGNLTKNLLLVFEEKDSNFFAEQKAPDFAFTLELGGAPNTSFGNTQDRCIIYLTDVVMSYVENRI